mmetsp:Transcript_31213/g.38115  ORF Transcript_31213/g.38115 Transcript_31213/m.38115 type:complete len:223 (+) Transcript_31213:1862-2530(+)
MTRFGWLALPSHLSNSLLQFITNDDGHTMINLSSFRLRCRAKMVVIVMRVLPNPISSAKIAPLYTFSGGSPIFCNANDDPVTQFQRKATPCTWWGRSAALTDAGTVTVPMAPGKTLLPLLSLLVIDEVFLSLVILAVVFFIPTFGFAPNVILDLFTTFTTVFFAFIKLLRRCDDGWSATSGRLCITAVRWVLVVSFFLSWLLVSSSSLSVVELSSDVDGVLG